MRVQLRVWAGRWGRTPPGRAGTNNGARWGAWRHHHRRTSPLPEGIVQTRRPGKQSDRKLSPGALAAIAAAARRSREAGVGPEPRRSRPGEPPTHGNADQPVTAPATPQPTRAAVTTAQAGRTPTMPVAPPTAPPPVPQTAPPSGGTRWAGHPPPADPAGFATPPADVPRRPTRPSGSGERRLRWAIGVVFGVLVIMVAALVGTANGGDRQSGGRATATTASRGAATRPVPGGSTSTTSGQGAVSPAPPSTPTSNPTSTATSPTLAEPGGPPALSALAPASGRAGQTVTVTGSKFLSSSGQISAQVGGQITPVACPDQTTCTVVIPPNPGSASSAPVTITTDSGTSNPLVFTYGAPATLGVLQTSKCVGGACPFRDHTAGRRRARR
jgi:hypothetical protein